MYYFQYNSKVLFSLNTARPPVQQMFMTYLTFEWKS